MAEYEAGFNGCYNEYFVKITVDRRAVKAGTTHRYPGFHADGVQAVNYFQNTHTPIEHLYIITSAPSTEFCIQPFFLQHLNDGRHSIFHEMQVQARETNVFRTLPWHVYLLDPYMVHRTPLVTEDTDRIFVRITFIYSELMNSHYTKNPLFNEQKYDEYHDIRKFLTLYPTEVPWEMYGFAFGPESANDDQRVKTSEK